ncbi:MAG: ABC transporter permease [Bacteroidales bacterium]|nr:ABC transporter permease [Bacteroidales bacterium]
MKNIFKIFKGSSLLNLLGMTVAFAAMYVLLVQVYYDLGYNRKIKDVERLYILGTPSWFSEGKYQVTLNRPLQIAIMEQASMVESWGVAYIGGDGKNYTRVGEGEEERTYQIGTSQLTRGALDVFGFTPVVGTFDGMDKEETVAISESAAKLMGVGVGDGIFVGKGKEPMTVVAVYEDMPMNSDLNNIHILYCCYLENQSIDNFSEWSYHHFVKLDSPDSKEAFETHARKVVEGIWGERIASAPESVRNSLDQSEIDDQIDRSTATLLPVKDMYYNKQIDVPAGRSGNRTTTLTLLAVAILIVVITLINFVNFFFAQIPMRIKGVNTRKILGSSRGALVGRLMVESGILVMVSLCAAVAVVVLFKGSTYANLITCTLDFDHNIPVICITIAAALLMTIASSVYPALYITSFSPAFAIKGAFGSTAKGKGLRYTLISLQFVISIAFVICAMFIKMQHSYMMNYDMGFDKEYLLTANVGVATSDRESFTDELLKDPDIVDVAWAAGPLVNSSRMGWGRTFKGEQINIDAYPVSWNFLKFMGIDIVEGRDFTPADEKSEHGVFIFNQIAKEKYGFTLEDKVNGHSAETEIAGFCEDFQFRPLQYELNPFAFYIFGKNPWWDLTHLYIRTSPGASYQDVQTTVNNTILKFNPGANLNRFRLRFFDEELGRQYRKEKDLTTMITLFTLIAIIISLMGVFGLVVFETQYRRKEIGVRRVLGSSVGEILKMFNMRFLKMLAVCFVIAVPISYFIIDFYYSTFAHSSPIYWWVFAAAGAAVALIVAAVVTVTSLRSATENPVESLRSE